MTDKKTTKGKITVQPYGSYLVEGDIPLVHKTQIV